LRREVIGLPVHQELRPTDLDRIVEAVRTAVPEARGSGRGIAVHGGLGEISAGWDALAEQCGASPFERPGWFHAWSAAFDSGTPWVVVNSSSDEILAVLPLVRSGDGLHSATNDHTPRFGLLARDQDAARELAAWVFERRPRKVTLEYVDPDHLGSRELEAAAASHGYRVLATTYERSPYLAVDGSWEDYERSLSGRVRRDLDRRLRRLEELGPVRLDVSDGTEGRTELLAEGFRLEPSGWKAAGGTAVASQEHTLRFYEELADWAANNGWLRLSFLRVGERAVAFQYGFEAGGTYYFLKGGYDPEYRRYAPGKLLLRALLERAFTTGLSRFDFLGADDPFKLEWSQTAYDLKLVQAFSPSPLGTAEWAAFAYGRPLARRVRARLRELRSR
jgi:CelD/BcsL family acetyltransferase involved in cellulose biosynthesis